LRLWLKDGFKFFDVFGIYSVSLILSVA